MEKKTCLYDRHVALGALMSPFGGFIMPIQYTNITDEHNAVRTACGVFDVSHMGEVRITGPDAERYVQHIFTNDVAGAPVGQIYYGMMLYPNGGTVDDLLVYKMGENDFFLVINAANIDKDVAWMQEHTAGFDIKLDHQSDFYGQLAVQGPEAEAVVLDVLGIDGRDLKFYTAKTATAPYASPATVPDGSSSGSNPRPCPKDCRRCPMAQQICCASMLSFQMYDVMSIVIQRLDAQQQTIAELSDRLSAIQSSEAELSAPLPIQPDLFDNQE